MLRRAGYPELPPPPVNLVVVAESVLTCVNSQPSSDLVFDRPGSPSFRPALTIALATVPAERPRGAPAEPTIAFPLSPARPGRVQWRQSDRPAPASRRPRCAFEFAQEHAPRAAGADASYATRASARRSLATAARQLTQASSTDSPSPGWCGPNARNSKPSLPASNARATSGSTRIASSGRTWMISSSSFRRPLPPRIT